MKKLFIALLMCCGALTTYSQENKTNVDIYHDKETGKYGYKSNGKIIIPAKYDAVEWPNAQGLLRVYVNKSGKVENNPITQTLSLIPWTNQSGYFGYLDLKGNVVVPIKYGWLDYLGGRFVGYIDKNKRTNKYAAFSEGDAKDSNPFFRTKKFGILDINGNVVLEPKFEHLEMLSDSIFMVITPSLEDKDNWSKRETFFVNHRGERLDKTNFDFIKPAKKIGAGYYVEKDGRAQIVGLHLEPLTRSLKINKERAEMEERLTEIFMNDYYYNEFMKR